MGIRYVNAGYSYEVRDTHGRDSAGLTVRQRQVLVVIAELRVELGACPTVRQVCDRLDIALGRHVCDFMHKLRSLGYVQHEEGSVRTLQPTDLGWRISGVDSNGLADPRVERVHRCHRCAAVTFKPHKPETCRQLLTGVPYIAAAE
jgi:SOS-response transcriptional repressor LexA